LSLVYEKAFVLRRQARRSGLLGDAERHNERRRATGSIQARQV
jgi:hypothetical protein